MQKNSNLKNSKKTTRSKEAKKCYYNVYSDCNGQCGRIHSPMVFSEQFTKIRDFVKERNVCVAYMLFGKCGHKNKTFNHIKKCELKKAFKYYYAQQHLPIASARPCHDHACEIIALQNRIDDQQLIIDSLRKELDKIRPMHHFSHLEDAKTIKTIDFTKKFSAFVQKIRPELLKEFVEFEMIEEEMEQARKKVKEIQEEKDRLEKERLIKEEAAKNSRDVKLKLEREYESLLEAFSPFVSKESKRPVLTAQQLNDIERQLVLGRNKDSVMRKFGTNWDDYIRLQTGKTCQSPPRQEPIASIFDMEGDIIDYDQDVPWDVPE